MKKIKYFTAWVLLCALVLSAATTAQPQTDDALYGVNIVLDGIPVEFADDMRPFIINGRTFVSVRAIAELLGLNVDFDYDTHTVILDSAKLTPRRLTFEFPYDYFTSEIAFTLESEVFPTSVTYINPILTNMSATSRYMQAIHRSGAFVKQVGDEWRHVPTFGRSSVDVINPALSVGQGTGGWIVHSIHLLMGQFAPGTYRIVTEVRTFEPELLCIEVYMSGPIYETHLVWVEFVIECSETEQALPTATDGVNIIFNGVPVEFEDDMRPFIMDGRTFLSVRAMAEVVGVDVDFDYDTKTVMLDSTYSIVRQFPIFQFPYESFTQEIIFVTDSDVYDTHLNIGLTLTNASVTPSYLRYVNFTDVLVKHVKGDEWRVIPHFPRLIFQEYWLFREGDSLDFLNKIIASAHTLFGEFAVGTYRIVTEVYLERIETRYVETHIIWAEFDIIATQ